MGKYEALETGVFSVFGSAVWKAEDIKTTPSNYIRVGAVTEFIRVNVIPSGKGLNLGSASGVLIIDIFTPVGKGPRRSSFIADKLDQYLVGKSVKSSSGVLQCSQSSLAPKGVDSENKSLFHTTYSIPFNFYGVSK